MKSKDFNTIIDVTWESTFGATSVGAWDTAATVREVVLDATVMATCNALAIAAIDFLHEI